mmetsp:Transcript_19550/g.45844  ORF Transcript_19550/g.45844 Transcript_19550/m.45844 type:complete len:327 (+) Transcript_19550:1436-2416(+)
MRSPSSPANSAYSASMEIARDWTVLRSAADTCPIFCSVTLSHEVRTVSRRALPLLSAASTCFLNFAISILASFQGPLVAFAALPSCALRQPFASAIASVTASAASVVALRTVMGFETVARSDSLTEVKGAAACSRLCSTAWILVTFSAMVLSTRETALRSFFSSCFLLSNSSLFVCSRLPSSIFLHNCSSFERRVLTLGRMVDNSLFASANGPCLHSLSSALLDAMNSDVFNKVLCVLLMVLSSLLMKAVYAVKGLKWVVPWLPCVVTHPVVPSLSTLTSTRMSPMASSDFGSLSASTTSSTKSVSMVLLWAMSRPSVMETSWVQM